MSGRALSGLKVATILGARPQFIKAAPLSRELAAAGLHELLIHTGQHYDYRMSQVFFDELEIRPPDLNLEIGSGPHGRQTGEMMVQLEKAIDEARPDWVLVYGDTNSTLAGAITAAKMRIPLAHVESGLRSHNRQMPEEHNRVLTDHCADLLLCPTRTAVDNLRNEGLTRGVHLVGDPMCDAIRIFAEMAAKRSRALAEMGLEPRNYLLATVHRPYNTDEPANLAAILGALTEVEETVLFPVHPRTRQQIDRLGDQTARRIRNSRLRMVEPLGYLDMLSLQQNARIILTDSGGIQKEAYMLGIPCITLRPETEWVETVESGWNVLAGADKDRILSLTAGPVPADRPRPPLFGDGYASRRIVELLQ